MHCIVVCRSSKNSGIHTYHTLFATSFREQGPCEGDPCPISSYCRSQYGFCGPGEDYCTDSAIWSKDCPEKEPTRAPSVTTTTTSFEKPQGGGKGEAGVTDSPSPVPINDATLFPTIHLDIDDPVDLISDSTQLDVITESPTYEPSARESDSAEAENTSASLEENQFACTGEPCEESSWCRSRYGSCGPGFIYCNANTIWDNSCPPIALALGRRPSRTPTIQTTEVPTGHVEEMGEMMSAPTLPALPMPTLPTITGGSDVSANFMSQTSLEFHVPSSSSSVELDEEEDSFETAVSDEVDEEEVEDELPKETDGGSMTSTQTPEFDEWLAFMNSGHAYRHGSIHLGVILSAVAFLLFELYL